MTIDLDHLSVAVRDLDESLKFCISKFGAKPIIGGVHPSFNYVLLEGDRAGTNKRIELISHGSAPDSFMRRFLTRHGEKAHHICFLVDEIETTIGHLRDHGFALTGADLTNPGWKEIFIVPDSLHSLVIQIASKEIPYPELSADEALEKSESHQEASEILNNRGATDALWWAKIAAGVDVGESLAFGPIILRTSNLARSYELFAGLLMAETSLISIEIDGKAVEAQQFHWPSGDLVVLESDTAGIYGVSSEEAWVGPTRLGEVPFLGPLLAPSLQ